MQKLLELRIPSHPDRLCLVRVLVRRCAQLVGCHEQLSEQLVLAVNEACMNIMQHAYKGDESGEIVLEIFNNGDSIHFHLRDFARPVDLDQIKPRALGDVKPGGLGTHFIREIMDECRIGHLDDGNGNYLEMSRKISDENAS